MSHLDFLDLFRYLHVVVLRFMLERPVVVFRRDRPNGDPTDLARLREIEPRLSRDRAEVRRCAWSSTGPASTSTPPSSRGGAAAWCGWLASCTRTGCLTRALSCASSTGSSPSRTLPQTLPQTPPQTLPRRILYRLVPKQACWAASCPCPGHVHDMSEAPSRRACGAVSCLSRTCRPTQRRPAPSRRCVRCSGMGRRS